MKVLFVAAEGDPYIKTGGLADVIGSLPKELVKQGIDVRVILPKYSKIAESLKSQMRLLCTFEVPVGWRRQYCGIEVMEHQKVTFYFVDNEYYFKRDGEIYGHYDDAERYAFFCRAVLEALPQIGWQPDILHAHDWHAGLVSVFLRTHYAHDPFFQNMRTVFTIHNLAYQGVFPHDVMQNLLGLGDEYFRPDLLEFYGAVNYMKGGLVYSDRLTTVSRTYALEIQYEFFGEKLDPLLRARHQSLSGIVNGIDYQSFNPMTDPHLYVNYRSSLAKKQENKVQLQAHLGLPVNKDVPMLAMITRLVSQKGLDLVLCVLDEILELDVQFVLIGTGHAQYEHAFREASYRMPEKMSANLLFDDGLARKLYAASDLFLMPSLFEPCGLGQLIAMRYGSVPIVRETGGLHDTVQSFNEFTGEGNGFSFAHYNAHDMLYTIRRALSFYHDKTTWSQIVKNVFKSDYSWNQSARQYLDLYEQLVEV
jgi:starch synthase